MDMGHLTSSARGDLVFMLLMFGIEGVIGGMFGTWLGLSAWWKRTKRIYWRALMLGIPFAAVAAAITAVEFQAPRRSLTAAVCAATLLALLRGWLYQRVKQPDVGTAGRV